MFKRYFAEQRIEIQHKQQQHNKGILVLNDQGGTVMHITYDVTNTLRAQDHGHPPSVLVYDARGNGGGETCPTITGDHQDRITDYTAIVVTLYPASDDMLKE